MTTSAAISAPLDRGAGTRRTRLQLGSIAIDRPTFAEALEAITEMVEEKRGGAVFTPNVDHVVIARDDVRFRGAYASADLSLADGMPIVWASRLLGRPVPEKISGSDLAPRLMELAAAKGWSVYLLGGGEGVAERASTKLREAYPGILVVGTASPRIDLREDPSQRQHILDEIRETMPDIVLVGLGAPKQELWIQESIETLRPAVLLGVGATIDFLAGLRRRAPAWMSTHGLEWTYRLAMEPRRLWRRYLLTDPRFIRVVLEDLFARARGQGPRP